MTQELLHNNIKDVTFCLFLWWTCKLPDHSTETLLCIMNWISASHFSVNICQYVEVMKPLLSFADDAEPPESVTSYASVTPQPAFILWSVSVEPANHPKSGRYVEPIFCSSSVMVQVVHKKEEEYISYFQIQQ